MLDRLQRRWTLCSQLQYHCWAGTAWHWHCNADFHLSTFHLLTLRPNGQPHAHMKLNVSLFRFSLRTVRKKEGPQKTNKQKNKSHSSRCVHFNTKIRNPVSLQSVISKIIYLFIYFCLRLIGLISREAAMRNAATRSHVTHFYLYSASLFLCLIMALTLKSDRSFSKAIFQHHCISSAVPLWRCIGRL